MAKLKLPMGATLSGRIGKSNYIAATRKGGTIVYVREKPYVPTAAVKEQATRNIFLQKNFYNPYREVVRVGMTFCTLEKRGDKEMNSMARFVYLNMRSVKPTTHLGASTYELKLDDLVLASGRLPLPDGLKAEQVGGDVKVSWEAATDKKESVKRQKIGVVVISEGHTQTPVISLGAATRNESSCSIPLNGLAGTLHVYVFVYDTANGSKRSSRQVHFKL